MKYIDAEKLISEIKIIQSSLENREVRCNQVKKIRTECMIEFCKAISEAITSLQQEQPEVDLEKDIDAFLDKWDRNSNGSLFDENGTLVTIKTIKGVVKHFLNARKEE